MEEGDNRGSAEPEEVRESGSEAKEDLRRPSQTSMVLRHVPNNFTRNGLLDLLELHSGLEEVNFLYLPIRHKDGFCLGYAFISFDTPEAADTFRNVFHGMHPPGASKALVVHNNERMQSLSELVARFRDSPILHACVPDHMKPMLFDAGRPMRFPARTKHVNPPDWARTRRAPHEPKKGPRRTKNVQSR